MTIQTRYHLKEDRMELRLQIPDGDTRLYWVTRRLWLGLLARLMALQDLPAADSGQEDVDTLRTDSSKAGQSTLTNGETTASAVDGSLPAASALKADLPAQPRTLKAIRVRRLVKSVQLVFVEDTSEETATSDQDDEVCRTATRYSATLTVPNGNLHRLKGLLRSQAKRAAWDVESAMMRLKSAKISRKALQKAKRGNVH